MPPFVNYMLIFFSTLTVTVLLEKRWIPFLTKKAQQPIYEEGPAWHIKKAGTPTMGGLAFIPAILLLWFFSPMMATGNAKQLVSLSITIGYAILHALLGILDDTTKLSHKKNKGLTPKEKLFFQFAFSLLFLFCREIFLQDGTDMVFPFGTLSLGYWYYPLMCILLVGFVNFANLTDGIDGLAASVAFGIGISLFFLSALWQEEIAFLSCLLIGISLGFLVFNIHPARIFMGDTGSLFFGALAVAMAFSLRSPLMVIGYGSVYVMEGLSVTIQVLVYKLTKKRVFLMAPLHHHFEKKGWSENKICLCAVFVTMLGAVAAFLLYIPR